MFHSEKVIAPRLADLRALAPIGARGLILSRIDHSPLSRLVSLSYPESKEEEKEEEKEKAKDGGREKKKDISEWGSGDPISGSLDVCGPCAVRLDLTEQEGREKGEGLGRCG